MQGIATIVVSVGLVVTTSFVLFSCLSCRRFVAKRKLKKQKKKEERVNVPEIKIDLGESHQEKQENGIENPAYQEPDGSKPDGNQQSDSKAESTEATTELKEPHEDVVKNENAIETNADEVSGEENKAFEEPKPKKQSEELPNEFPAEDLSEVQSKESESVRSDDDEVFQKRVEEQNSSVDDGPTKLFKNELSEEELEAYNDVVFQGEWRRPVALKHLLEIGLIDKKIADGAVLEAQEAKKKMEANGYYEEEEVPKKLRRYLCGDQPVAGILVTESGEKKSIFKSAKEGILRRGTAISLLEAQAATGNIIDPVTGRKMSVKEAAQLGLLDKVYETVLLRAERAVCGYKFRASDHVLSLFEAMQKGLVVESHGLRLLEAQCATGGVIDHRINIRVPLDVAVERGLLDERLKEKLEDDDGEETKTFFDPNTERNVTYKELMKTSILDTDTGLRLYPLEKIIKKRVSYGSYSGRSSLSSSRTVSRSNSRENIPAALASP